MNRPVRVGITHGDYNGVAYEVMLKALADETVTELMTPVLFADWRLVQQAVKTLGIEVPGLARIGSASEAEDGQVNVVDLRLKDATVDAGHPSAASGAAAVLALKKAMDAIGAGEIDVLVTAPISKEAAQSDTFRFPGHTEFLEACAGEGHHAQMILFNDMLRVALVTTHLPIAEIPKSLTREKISDAIMRFNATLRQDFGLERPKIAVLSLNPHCGDGGLLGSEEKEVIAPAIEEVSDKGVLAFGPFPADGFFGSGVYRRYDGVLAMYHDQGLAPFKTIAGESGVNFTAGLPFVRTSPDHGTACDIAWKSVADPASMREAIYKAIDIFRCRQNHLRAAANPLRKAHVAKASDKGEEKNHAPAKAEKEGTDKNEN